VSFPDIAWTSFDRYARYGAIARALEANLGAGRHTVLDVGDNTAYLETFAPELRVVSVDQEVNPRPLPGLRLALADGAALPVATGSVDAVVSSDALEHVQPDDRPAFVAEMARCARDLVVLAAPFDTPGVAGTEELVRRFVAAATGAPQPQLDEHAARGLPDLAATQALLEGEGLQVVAYGNGNLRDWMLALLLKHQITGPSGFADLDIGFDVFYNLVLEGRNEVPPFYRHVLVGRRSAAPVRGAPRAADGTEPLADSLLPALVAAIPGFAGAQRHAAHDRSDLDHRLDALDARLDGIEGALVHLMERFSGVEAALAQLDGRSDNLQRNVEAIRTMLRHPVRTLSRRGRDD
jgi:SAM-dependent methyltransferase